MSFLAQFWHNSAGASKKNTQGLQPARVTSGWWAILDSFDALFSTSGKPRECALKPFSGHEIELPIHPEDYRRLPAISGDLWLDWARFGTIGCGALGGGSESACRPHRAFSFFLPPAQAWTPFLRLSRFLRRRGALLIGSRVREWRCSPPACRFIARIAD